MSASQRRKGQTGERELFALLSAELGTVVRRNVDQARAGGADGIDIPGWAIEVKRQESGFRESWWDQAIEQADKTGRMPALAYRASRQPWRVRVLVNSFDPFVNGSDYGDRWAEVDLSTFAFAVRESL